jgi:hypothetical protein
MIRNETEYQEAVRRLSEDEEIKRIMDPMESFFLQFKEEVENYAHSRGPIPKN